MHGTQLQLGPHSLVGVGDSHLATFLPTSNSMVWVTADLQNICWCAVGSKASRNGKLPVARLTAVLAGQQTPVFLRRKGRPNRDAASFSLVFGDDRTLDLEVKEHTHTDCHG